MPDRPETEPIETVEEGYSEIHPESERDVERARRQEELLGSSPGTTKDRSTTGESHPVEYEDVDGPVISDDDPSR